MQKFKIGEYVYLKTDPEQFRRMVTGYLIRANSTAYVIAFADRPESHHYEYELSTERDLLLTLNIDTQPHYNG